MSTDYEIRCSCGSSYGRDNWRIPADVNVLLCMRAELAAVAKGVTLYAKWPMSFSLDGWDVGMFPGIFQFFLQHEGHEMHVYNEYGDRWPNCPDGTHDMERKWSNYAKCRVCEYSDHTEGHKVTT